MAEFILNLTQISKRHDVCSGQVQRDLSQGTERELGTERPERRTNCCFWPVNWVSKTSGCASQCYYYILYLTRLSLIEIKISFTRETWPRWTAVHSCNIKHKTKYKFNTKYNSNNTFRSLTITFAFSNGIWHQTHTTALNSLRVTRSCSLSCFCRLFQEDGAKTLKAFFSPVLSTLQPHS